MSDFTIIVTDAGRAALVNAAHNGTVPVTIAAAGLSATAIVPMPQTAMLPAEIKRIATLAGDVVAADTIHLIIRDESADQYALRSLAFYLADGTLFAVYGQAAPIIEKSAQSMLLLAVDVRFADIDAAELSFGNTNFLNPPATTELAGVVELATETETTTGSDTTRAATPKGIKAAVTSWLDARFGAGAPSAFIKGLLTTASATAFRAALAIKSAALRDEGAGGGLDADLLDGQHGAWYVDIPTRLGFMPWGPSNDGAGSGLDADLLDGQEGSWYANIAARLGFMPWGPNNDGAGSGLDADLLDGRDGGWYAPVNNPAFTSGITVGGNVLLNAGSPTINFNSTGPRIYVPAPSMLAFGKGQGVYNVLIDNDGNVSLHGSRGSSGILPGAGSLRVVDSTVGGTAISTYSTQNYTAIGFHRDVGGVAALLGSIVVGESSTSYLIGSDYRLKENIVPLTGALARVLSTPVRRYNYIAAPGVTVDGFLAHEAARSVPEAVHGAKDAVDANGKPVHQGLDPSKMVPVLWAAVQELAAASGVKLDALLIDDFETGIS